MSKDIREMIDKVKNLKSLNENLSLGNIKTILYNNGIKNFKDFFIRSRTVQFF